MSPYVLLDDGFHSNPKVLDAGLDGAGLYARALSFCGAYLTDGHVTGAAMVRLADGKQKLIDKCVSVGLFEAEPDGYRIPDFLEINDSREVITARRKQKQEAGRKGAAAKHLPSSRHGTRQASATAGATAPATPSATADIPGEPPGETVARVREALSPSPYLERTTAEQTVVKCDEAALPNKESLEELGQRVENGRAEYGSVDSVFEVIDKPASNTRRELEKWLAQLPASQVEHVREQVLACEPRKSKAAYAVGTAQRLVRDRGAE